MFSHRRMMATVQLAEVLLSPAVWHARLLTSGSPASPDSIALACPPLASAFCRLHNAMHFPDIKYT